MRRRRAARRDDGISLFPFLAVLICTMGALIVLLVVIVQQAKAKAVDVVRQRTTQHEQLRELQQEQYEQLRLQQEELQWRIQVLKQSRTQTAEQLEDRRRELSHLEDVMRDLQQQLERIAIEARAIQEHAQPANTDLQAARERRDRLRQELQQARQAIEEARTRLNNQSPSYAIVPYMGPHGTRRRPIFVECLDDRVVLQPEGIALLADDFRDPITDDNALASALRAKREYLADVLGDRDGQPYPLLIVRPQGAHAYAAARAAMKSWEAEFGYELVDATMPLQYPPIDAGLVDEMQKAVDQARARRRYLQSIAPARFGRSDTVLRPSQSGGFESIASAGNAGSARDDDQSGLESDGEEDGWGRPAAAAQRTSAAGSRSLREPPAAAGIAGGSQDLTEGPDTSDLALTDRSPTASADRTSPAAASQQRRADGGPMAARDQRGAAGRQPGFASSSAGRATPNAGSTVPSPAGQESMLPSVAPADATDPFATSGSASGSASGSSSSADSSSESSPQMVSAMLDLSKTRGQNWALSEDAVGATGITRPIRLACYSDRILILPEDERGSKPEELVVTGNLHDQIDELVSRIGKRIEGWGIAGPGMYWKPVLVVQVPRSAEQRYRELAGLLQNSGIEVKRR